MKNRQLENEFASRGPWATQFVIDGESYGGELCYDGDKRINEFIECFPDAKSILDLGSLEGAHTFALAARPGVRVVGVDGRASNVEKARFVQRTLKVNNVEFVLADLERASLAQLGHFDAVFCSGLLYHLSEPWRCLEQIAEVTGQLFIWSHYANIELATETKQGYPGVHYQEGGLDDPLSGLSEHSFVLTLPALLDLLRGLGFTRTETLEDKTTPPVFLPGLQRTICGKPEVTIAAWKAERG